MSADHVTLAPNPALPPVQDFYELRREGIGFIANAASARWTDYNIHDPGVTFLEALCYAITDIGYRIDWNIADILTPQSPSPDPLQPYPNQAFFTARDILTVNPTTSDDFRRLLIDLPAVRDAWLVCKTCAYEVRYFAWCDNDQLNLSYDPPSNSEIEPKKGALGLYEVLLELEDDPELGNLNDRMIVHNTTIQDEDGVAHPLVMELRFPDIALLERDQWQLFLDDDQKFTKIDLKLGATKDFDVFTDQTIDPDTYIRNQWRNLFYLSFTITSEQTITTASEQTIEIQNIEIKNAALRVFGDAARNMKDVATALKTQFKDTSISGFIQRYRRKAKAAQAAIASAKTVLQAHRNLNEDYRVVRCVGVEDVAVCADVEVSPDADIEWIQARIWFAIEQYFSPPIRFRTLQELLDAGNAVESIFDGPALDNGFIETDDLEATALKAVLRTSDIINSLMDIDGVIAVNQLRLTKFDADGAPVRGAADPTWTDNEPVFDDPNKLSAAWQLYISSRHRPRLYLNQSRFMFYKNGLPFLPRMDEATDTLNQLRGEAERPKNPNADNDLRIPKGEYRNPDDYYPLQYSLPLAYGVGPAGLSPQASPLRRAQASDLKAYLMVYEQFLGNALTQLAHTADLFSLDHKISHTYFVKAFNETAISGFDNIVKPTMSLSKVEALVETVPEFHQRRNQFLDHLLARFGEQFSEYALLLTDIAGVAVAQPRLIENKIAFLESYPAVSHDRNKAFNYNKPDSDNNSGLKKRIMLLLGYADLTFAWTLETKNDSYKIDFNLVDSNNGRHWLDGSLTINADSEAAAKRAAYDKIVGLMIQSSAYKVVEKENEFSLTLLDADTEIGSYPQSFAVKDDALPVQKELLAWAAGERLIVVEHLLLRPKFIGDALYPACCDGGCTTCGAEDPYSFRLTFVMPGWTAEYTDNLELRRFADRTIRQETPSHLLAKICWVGNDGFIENPCDDIIGNIADLLIAEGLTSDGMPPSDGEACDCANAIYTAFSSVFADWYRDKKFVFLHADALQTQIGALFKTELETEPSSVSSSSCPTVPWNKVQDMMAVHFVNIALNGWQFERFEWAWRNWLNANAKIDWTDERLQERVEAILSAGLSTADIQPSVLSDCARTILTNYGMAFYKWMQANIAAGTAFNASFPPDDIPDIALCAGMFKDGTAAAITTLLNDRYNAYREPSYWLWAVVTLLSGLRNTYPGATLHDCDDGSDQNPVRLDSTALGNYPLRTTLT